jgi:hypothetical protein
VKKLIVLWLALGLALAGAASAQDYSFRVPRCMLWVYVNPDASARLEYTVEFACQPGAHAIDIVDMGLPHRGYEISNMKAALNGAPLTDIRKSTAIDTGVEVHLEGNAIQPGESGTLTFEATIPNLVYQDTTRKDYASLRITPTWWGGQYVVGETKLGIVVYLPRDISPDEVLDQGQRFDAKAVTAQYTTVGWLMDATRMDQEHLVGLSFPKRGMDRVVRQTKLDLLLKWWRETPDARALVGIVLAILFGIMFFRASQGTGCSCFMVLLALLIMLFVNSPTGELLAIPGLAVVWAMVEAGLRRRRGHYFPAVATVEGAGIKRGLTAPEAAALLELPLSQVLTLIICGLLKKGIIRQLEAEPLRVQLTEAYDKETGRERQEAAASDGSAIHAYEQGFIDVIRKAGGRPVKQLDFREPMKAFVEQTAKRMEGFDVVKTREYYRGIVAGAWAEAKALGDLQKRTEFTDDNLLWLMVGDHYHDDFGHWHRSGYYYDPPWTRSGGGWGGTAEAPSAPAPTPVGGHTTLGDVGASFAGWTQNVAGSLAGSIDGMAVQKAAGGVMNLAGVDKVTMDVLEQMSKGSGSGSGGGGGGGGGCACACAGCACACACAGGGR